MRETSIAKQCSLCKKSFTIQVNLDDFNKWEDGMVIQKAMPYLSADERELLISGYCRECFDIMMGEIEEDYDTEEPAF